MHIPFFNLQREQQAIKTELYQAASAVIDSGHYILGSQLQNFEQQFASYLGVKHCFGVGNGLDALVLLLRALDIKSGDEVIVPAHTFIATWLAVSQVGAKIVPVEPDDSYNIDAESIKRHITDRTKAIIPVHLYGRPADMTAINDLAKQHNLRVIEDAAQAQGSRFKDQACGNLADAAAFSFYPAKNLGACGDAGAITTNNDDIAGKIRALRNYGSVKKYHHHTQGINSRLDEMQAALLQVKLKYLDNNNHKKQNVAEYYLNNIDNNKVVLPPKNDAHYYSTWHQFVLQVEDRNTFIEYLNKHGIDTLIHYPVPAHHSGAYQQLFADRYFPITEKLSRTVVSIPIYATLTEQETEHIINTINQF